MPTGGKTSPMRHHHHGKDAEPDGVEPEVGDQRKGQLQGDQQQRDLVHEHADDEVDDDDADDDDPAVEVHLGDRGNHVLGHPAAGP